MATHYLNPSYRMTDAASLVEGFLNDNELDLSPNIFSLLDFLAGEIETIETNLNTKIEELESDLEAANARVEELENELEELR